ncbi:MAG: Uma2 family endonuclease [Leptospirales bacterium]
MATATQIKPRYEGVKVTREEYLDLEEDGFIYDMIDGVLIMSPSPFFEHNDTLAEILFLFKVYLKKTGSAKAVPETDIYLPDGADVLRPDISVILKENYGIIKGHIHGVPDIVVEVLSKSTKERDLGVKANRYLENGVKEYWIADTDKKSISLWLNENNENKKNWKKIESNQIESVILPGFILYKEEVFPKES